MQLPVLVEAPTVVLLGQLGSISTGCAPAQVTVSLPAASVSIVATVAPEGVFTVMLAVVVLLLMDVDNMKQAPLPFFTVELTAPDVRSTVVISLTPFA